MTDRNMNDCNKHMPLDPPGTLRQNQMIHRPTSHPQHHHRIPHAAPEENGRDLYPPSRMIPPSLKPPPVSLVNYPQLCSDEFIGQGSNRLHPDTLRGQSEFVDQDSRRFHVSNIPRMMSQPSPRYQELSYPVALPSPPPFTPSQRGYQLNNEHSFAASAALKSDVRHRSLLQYSEGEEYYRGPNCSNTGQDMIHQTAAYFHHDNRRLNIRDGAHTLLRQPNPSHPPAVSHQFNRGYQLDNPYTMLAATRNLIQDRPPSLAAAPRHNSLPGLLRHPDEGEHVGTSARYNSRNPPHHNPESGHYQQGTKRLKIDEGTRSVVRHSKNQTAGPVQPLMVRESRHEESNTSNNNRPRLLCLPDDEKHLTELHCFVRKSCVFILSATSKDVGTPRKGRKKALRLGQIGIGCLYCSNAENKLKGSTYYPTCISGIYNATMIIQQRHFAVCPFVSREVFAKYSALKNLTARSGSTKEYWILAANKLGLVDTVSGVFFQSSVYDVSVDGASLPVGIPQAVPLPPQGPLPSLVEPSDKVFATEYSYFVVEQMTTCEFTEADRLGKRKCHKLGFPGMACRHCFGCNGSGRFFPLTLKTFSDVSKSIHVLRNHLVKCTKAPSWLAQTVNKLYEQHKEEKLTTPFGSQKIFFDLIWRRLHDELHLDIPTEGVADDLRTAAAPPKQFSRQERGQKKRADAPQQIAPDNTLTTTPVQSPPVIHRGKTIFRPDEKETEYNNNDEDDDAHPNRSLLCMIPKKRYLYSQSSTTIVMPQNASDLGLSPPTTSLLDKQKNPKNDQGKSDDHRKSDDQRNQQQYQQLLSSPPSPRQQVTKSFSESPPSKQHDTCPPSTLDDNNHRQQASYSEHDVSIALILANGFGKHNPNEGFGKSNANEDWGEKKDSSSSVIDEPKRAEV